MHSWAAMAVLMTALGGNPDGVVLNFTASWCGPCQQMAPVVSRLQQQGYAIQKVDIDQQKELAERFRIGPVPTFVLIVRGEERGRYSGAMSESDLRRIAASIPEKQVSKPAVAETKPASKSAWSWSRPKLGDASSTSSKVAANSSANGVKSNADGKSIFRANLGEGFDSGYSKDPMKVSVRLKTTDKEGIDWGSGTVIHSEANQALILTCGHIFRRFDQRSRLEVDLFDDSDHQRLDGEVVTYDLKADIGLVKVVVPKMLPVARIASKPLKEGDHVFSVGCGGGAAPAKWQHHVTKTTGYVEDIVECTGVPVSGRSGGGLFNASGEIVGVCILADPNGKRGLYTGLKTIHQLIARSGLRQVGNPLPDADLAHLSNAGNESLPGRAPSLPDDAASDEAPQFEAEPTRAPQLLDDRSSFGSKKSSTQSLPMELMNRSEPKSSSGEGRQRIVAGPNAAALRETLNGAKGSEVVCIIRDPSKPDAASRVVIIHRASERFVADLTGEVEQQIQPTSMPVRKSAADGVSKTASAEKVDPESLRFRRTRP